jgi:hypothetical protein
MYEHYNELFPKENETQTLTEKEKEEYYGDI